jgi:hypothetical protein
VTRLSFDLSCDPGIGVKNGTGWATWLARELGHAGLIRPPDEPNLDLRTRKIVEQLPPVDGVLHLEHMQVYRGQRQKEDPNDLVALAYLEGMISARYAQSRLYVPHEWKGNLPDEVLAKRIDKRLSEIELARLTSCLQNVPKSLRHNVYAAVGIGLFALGRLH